MTTTNSLRASAMIAAIMVGAALLVMFYSGLASAQTSTAAAPGTTITVNSKGDGTKTGNCTLREAIEAANTNATVDGCAAGSSTDQDAIHFALGKEATIILDSHLPPITDAKGLTINGRKADITVSGNDAVRIFEVGSNAERLDAMLTLRRLTVADGLGSGIVNFAGTLTVAKSTFSGNSAGAAAGGAILNDAGTLTVAKSTFSGNSAGGGGAISNNGGTLTVTNSTFSGNSAVQGGAIENSIDALLTVTNSTFSGNSAEGANGGGIFNRGTATLNNTVVANSPSGGNCSGTITDGGYNIDDGTTCGFSQANNSMPSTEPKLASSLANNGGPTMTIRLLDGSPAINAIPKLENGCGAEITTDQRGVRRPQGKGCDIGAFEKKVRRR